MQELEITKKSKNKARKRRQKNESKWMAYRIITLIFVIACVMSFVVGIFLVKDSNYELFNSCAIVFSVTLIGIVVTKSFLTKASSHWIQDRLNERVWIENNQMYHFMQTSFAAGLNTYNADERAYLFVMDISTIRNAKYDDKSGRIEFTVNGNGYHYSDYRRNLIDKDWLLNGFEAVFYDAMQPSLFETLKNYGVKFQIGTINYKFTNRL